jgi:hypothetical protein
LARLLARIEQMARAGDVGGAATLVRALLPELRRARAALDAEVGTQVAS